MEPPRTPAPELRASLDAWGRHASIHLAPALHLRAAQNIQHDAQQAAARPWRDDRRSIARGQADADRVLVGASAILRRRQRPCPGRRWRHRSVATPVHGGLPQPDILNPLPKRREQGGVRRRPASSVSQRLTLLDARARLHHTGLHRLGGPDHRRLGAAAPALQRPVLLLLREPTADRADVGGDGDALPERHRLPRASSTQLRRCNALRQAWPF